MLKQATRLLSLKTPVSGEPLVLRSFAGREELSRLFRFQLDLLSDNTGITAQDLVGKSVTFGIQMPDESHRLFNGFVNRFLAGDEGEGRRSYRADVVPWLWFLTRTSDCRIFQHKSVPEILEQVFDDLGFKDYDTSRIKGSHLKRDFCVQYRESDFDFVSRLAEEEGIFYFFKHEDGKHTLILADQVGAYTDCLEREVDYPTDVGSRAIEDYVTHWEHQYEFRSGKWAQTDYNFETPKVNLMTNTQSVLKLPGIERYEVYDYPGEYAKVADGNALTRLRIEAEEAGFDTVQGASYCRSFTPGGKFKLRQHRAASEKGKSYVLTAVEHIAHEPLAYETGVATDGPEYRNHFLCIPEKVVFRPERQTPRPVIHGLQTAVVVGPPDEEIYPDPFGRVKVQFHWDRVGTKDENSSCWIRVSQTHAGPGFGVMNIPRVGEEVVVSFLEGNPDQPLIVGRVYHADNMPPYGLPGSKTISGMRSKTYKGAGYNEMIMDDTPGKELVRIHGQYDMDTTVEHDQRLTVKNDRSNTILGKLSENITNDTEITVLSGPYTHKVAGNTATYFVKGDLTEIYEAKQTTQVTGPIEYSSAANIVVSAADEIKLVTGSSSIVMRADGTIVISGKTIEVSGTAETKIGVGNQCVLCDTAQVATSGAAIASSATGKHEITGAVVKIN